jgi:hypothetical protein
MNIFDLTSNQLKRAAAIKDQIEALNNQLRGILGASTATTKKPSARAPVKKSVAAKPMQSSGKAATKTTKKAFSAATRAKLSAKLKAYWAAKKAGKK